MQALLTYFISKPILYLVSLVIKYFIAQDSVKNRQNKQIYYKIENTCLQWQQRPLKWCHSDTRILKSMQRKENGQPHVRTAASQF
jgi:hypothetical protein